MINVKELPGKIERYIRHLRDFYLRKYSKEVLPTGIFDKTINHYKVSFCTTCMNRLFHLKYTLEKNIKDNINYPKVEFILINYNSQDNLHSWIKNKFKKYIDSGILIYAYTNTPSHFHASKAKNLAHKLATGDIVCNLDGDNFTGENYAFYINYLFNQHGKNHLFHFKKAPYWGTEGRIVMTRENFISLGGYDESFLATGHEDHDLINRAVAMGLEYKNIQIENFLRYLSNTTREKAKNCSEDEINYYDLESKNRIISEENIKNRKLVANQKNGWANSKLYINFSNNLTSLS